MPAQRVVFDLNRSSDGGRGSIVPDGVYKLRVDEVEVKQGNAGPYVALKLKIISGGKGTLYSNLSTSKASRWVVDSFLDAAGFGKKGQTTPDKFRGKEVWAELGNSSYEAVNKQTGKKEMRMKNEIRQWLDAETAAQLSDVYAQNKTKAVTPPEVEPEEAFANSEEAGEEEEDEDDESVFAGMPAEDDEFGPA